MTLEHYKLNMSSTPGAVSGIDFNETVTGTILWNIPGRAAIALDELAWEHELANEITALAERVRTMEPGDAILDDATGLTVSLAKYDPREDLEHSKCLETTGGMSHCMEPIGHEGAHVDTNTGQFWVTPAEYAAMQSAKVAKAFCAGLITSDEHFEEQCCVMDELAYRLSEDVAAVRVDEKLIR